ncbi:MAG: NAD(P)H-dependent oxidoreductase [Treponema sp.]|jgi:flavodoxin|nr:NAD(P)H-dependent oxidoreductase [Treponema sp.]
MKTLVVYFSYEGNCSFIAEQLKGALNADILQLHLVDDKKRTGLAKYVWGGRQVMIKETPALKPYTVAMEQYDLIILGTPVWAGSPTPAMHAFLEHTKATLRGKKIALFCCHAGGKGKVFDKLAASLGENTLVGTIDFINPTKQDKQAVIEKLNGWVKQIQGCHEHVPLL